MDDFIKRLEKIFEYYTISASIFADKIGVQRSSLSHLLSGRNKPSLDLIIKIVENFKEVDLEWIIFGKGNFPKEENIILKKEITAPTLFNNENLLEPNLFSEEPTVKNNDVFENEKNIFPNNEVLNNSFSNTNIDHIVVFYKNGKFKMYFEN